MGDVGSEAGGWEDGEGRTFWVNRLREMISFRGRNARHSKKGRGRQGMQGVGWGWGLGGDAFPCHPFRYSVFAFGAKLFHFELSLSLLVFYVTCFLRKVCLCATVFSNPSIHVSLSSASFR